MFTSESKLRSFTLNANSHVLEERIQEYAHKFAEKFAAISRSYAFFNLIYFAIGTVELFAFLFFSSFLTKSTLVAFALAALLLTLFSYFVLRFYFQAKKPQEFSDVKAEYWEECNGAVLCEKDSLEYHQALSTSFFYFASILDFKILKYDERLKKYDSLSPLIEKFIVWMHWKDFHLMKEMLLLCAVNQHVQMVKAAPTDLEVHATLATAYLSLSKLYKDPKKDLPNQTTWIPPEYSSLQMQAKLKAALDRAIQEFKILDHYAPKELWVHAQLAAIYHELEMAEQEIQAYEMMLKISPQDREILFRLGVLYFQQGQNAEALRLYDQLKKIKDNKADELIAFYDAYHLYTN